MLGCSGRGELAGLLSVFVVSVSFQQGVEGVVAEVALADEPFVVLFEHDAGGESDQGAVVGEDADDVAAAAGLAVDAFERVGRAQLWPVVGGEGVEGEQSSSASSRSAAIFGSGLRSRSSASLTSSRACSP